MNRSKLEREATLRRRGFSEKEIASAERFNSRSTILLAMAVIAVIIMAALFGYSLTSKTTVEEYPATRSGVPVEAEESGPRKTISDFFRSQFAAAEPEVEEPAAKPAAVPQPVRKSRKAKLEADPAPPEVHVPQVEKVREVARPQFAGPDKAGVRRTTIRALKRGQPQVWKADGQRGYVLVSSATDYSDRTCRQVSYTLISSDNAQMTSAPTQWCQIRRGEWGEDPYTGQ